jgi:hypothetical protein
VNRIVALLATAATGLAASQANAIDLGLGIFKKKAKPEPTNQKPDPTLRVRQLLATLQADADVTRRKAAASELKSFDPRANPELIPQLAATLLKDPSPSVRAAAAESLGAIRQVYQVSGLALESSEKNDPDADVRAAAKSALWQYNLNGYRSTTPSTLGLPQSVEPPLAARQPLTPSRLPHPTPTSTEVQFRPITQETGKGVFYQPTAEPPLARPRTPAPPAVVPDTKPGATAPTVLPPTAAPVVPLDKIPAIPAPVVPLTSPVQKPAPIVPLETPTVVPAIPDPTPAAKPLPSPPTVTGPTVLPPPSLDPLTPTIPQVPSGTAVPTVPLPPPPAR